MAINLEETRVAAEDFLAKYGGAVLACHRKHPENNGDFARGRAFNRLRRYWAKRILAAFDES